MSASFCFMPPDKDPAVKVVNRSSWANASSSVVRRRNTARDKP
jgi:hypothetical protein